MVAGGFGPEWEIVHTVFDFYDRPRQGLADYAGRPHAYACEWSDEEDDWSDVFGLKPVTREQFLAVMEAWEIWRRWEQAHHSGVLGEGDVHPALAVDRARHESLRPQVEAALQVEHPAAIRAIADFRVDSGSVADFAVRWSPL